MPAPVTSAARTILFVEDEPLIAMVAAAMVSDLGYNVLKAGSGKQALTIIESDAVVDLLITDYSMPNMNGAELAKAAIALRPGLPVVIATGYSELPEHLDMSVGRLAKPYEQDQLGALIETLLGPR